MVQGKTGRFDYIIAGIGKNDNGNLKKKKRKSWKRKIGKSYKIRCGNFSNPPNLCEKPLFPLKKCPDVAIIILVRDGNVSSNVSRTFAHRIY